GVIYNYNRAKDIEIFTSNSSSSLIHGDNCNIRNMGLQFKNSMHLWRPCGVTKKQGDVADGEMFHVKCVAEVRSLLLRRNVSKDTDGHMSFADLRLQTGKIKVESPKAVLQHSAFSVRCLLDCNGRTEFSPKLELCLPNGSCVGQAEAVIHRAQLWHHGNYTCKLGSSRSSKFLTVF
uniref:Ig-like domain-containing protein n=1 Tax=Macrostomum lignano TaxID=282301 RepID=A0A1I8H768_9PLAT